MSYYYGTVDTGPMAMPIKLANLGRCERIDDHLHCTSWKSNNITVRNESQITSDSYFYGLYLGSIDQNSRAWTVEIPAIWAEICGWGDIRLPSFPEHTPHVDYEFSEEEFKSIVLGDTVLSADNKPTIVTDKVVSYENGEVHYDCTTMDAIEISAEQ